MAKRMQYSVVGLPHYTIWHLYEPSVDDIRHMEEMEAERQVRDSAEKEKVDRERRLKNDFGNQNTQWENDKTDIKKIESQEAMAVKGAEQKAGGADGINDG